MKFLSIMTIVLLGLVFEAKAQLCGTYTTTLKITNEAGLPVKNTSIKIIPLQEDNYTLGRTFKPVTGDSTRFSVSFNEGFQVRGDYKIEVGAPGFLPAETKTKFPHCADRFFQVILRPKGAAEKSSSDFLDAVEVRGEIYENEKAVSLVSITVLDDSNGGATKIQFKTKVDPNGRFQVELPYGDYTFVFQKEGYKTLRVTNVELKKRLNVYLYNVKLEKGDQNSVVERDYKDLYKSQSVH